LRTAGEATGELLENNFGTKKKLFGEHFKINSKTVLPVEFLNENRKWVNREFPRNSLVVRGW
jgi:hypothetical protein